MKSGRLARRMSSSLRRRRVVVVVVFVDVVGVSVASRCRCRVGGLGKTRARNPAPSATRCQSGSQRNDWAKGEKKEENVNPVAGNSGGYVKGTWSWVWGGRRGRESRGVEEMTGLWEESDGTGAATIEQREKAPGGLAGWAALRAGRWRVERDGRWQGRVGFCGGRRLAVDRAPQACWTLPDAGTSTPTRTAFQRSQ